MATPNVPSDANQIQGWDNAQAQSKAFSDTTTTRYNSYNAARIVNGKPFYALGEGSPTPGSFVTNGKEPNTGNTP